MTKAVYFSERERPAISSKALEVGCLLFEGMDQIDFTGPFEVLSRMPSTTVRTYGKGGEPIHDVQGLKLMPDARLEDVANPDILLIPGGYGQQRLIADEEFLSLIRRQAQQHRIIFSVCTGALLCGAAGILSGRSATTHWASLELLPYYGAIVATARVVVDGNLISAAGVTAGLDAALVLVALLRGNAAAQEIQLAIEYDPQPVFQSGSPGAASSDVLNAFEKSYAPVRQARQAEAFRFGKPQVPTSTTDRSKTT